MIKHETEHEKLQKGVEEHKQFIDKIMQCKIPQSAKHAYLITRIVFFDCDEIPPNYPEHLAIIEATDNYQARLDTGEDAEPYMKRKLVSIVRQK